MLCSQSLGNLFAALAKARVEFHPVLKNKIVSVRGSRGSYDFLYADLDQIISAVEAALSANELTVTQLVGTGVLTTIIGHSSGEYIGESAEFSLNTEQIDQQTGEITKRASTEQEKGARITYLRRYALQSILGIAAETDDDGAAEGTVSVAPKSVPANVGPQSTPQALDSVEDFSLKVMEAQTIAQLTKIFNSLPSEARRPGTDYFHVFSTRRGVLVRGTSEPHSNTPQQSGAMDGPPK